MNALSLYVTTTRMIFMSSIDDGGAWADINRLVLYLRQALTCCVCGKLLTIPMSSTVSSCQHHVCKACVGGKMRLKPSCSWCKDHSKFIENTQLRILLQSYKKLCDYMVSAQMSRRWGQLTSGSASGTNMSFAELVAEGCSLADRFSFSEPPSLRGYARPAARPPPITNGENKTKELKEEIVKAPEPGITHHQLLSNASYSALPAGTSLIRTASNANVAAKIKAKRRGCRCGLATKSPGKLTCCGQRCPCYVEGKGCFECKCRGCRNPHRVKETSSMNSLMSNSTPITINVATVSPTLTSSASLSLSPSLASSLIPGLRIGENLSPSLEVQLDKATDLFPKLDDAIVEMDA